MWHHVDSVDVQSQLMNAPVTVTKIQSSRQGVKTCVMKLSKILMNSTNNLKEIVGNDQQEKEVSNENKK